MYSARDKKSDGLQLQVIRPAYFELSLAMFFLGVNVVTGKCLVTSFPIYLLLGLRFLIGTLTFLPILYLQRNDLGIKKHSQYKLKYNDWIILFLQAFFGALLFNLLMLHGLKLSTATAAGILTSATPAFTALLSFLFLAEEINKKKLLAISAAILGIAIINISGNFKLSWDILGNTLIVLAVIAGAFLTIFIKMLSDRVTPLGMSFTFNFFGLVILLPFAIWDGLNFQFSPQNISAYVLAVLYGVSGSVMFPILWNRGISAVSASTASLFSGVMPISTAFLAYAFLGENFTLMQAIGMVCVLLAIGLDVYRFPAKKPSVPM